MSVYGDMGGGWGWMAACGIGQTETQKKTLTLAGERNYFLVFLGSLVLTIPSDGNATLHLHRSWQPLEDQIG